MSGGLEGVPNDTGEDTRLDPAPDRASARVVRCCAGNLASFGNTRPAALLPESTTVCSSTVVNTGPVRLRCSATSTRPIRSERVADERGRCS